MKKISLSLAAVLVASSAAWSADSLAGMFKEGKVSGDVGITYQVVDPDAGQKSGYTNTTVGIAYTTGSMNGFSATVEGRANIELTEEHHDDFEAANSDEGILAQANIKYENDAFAVILGRQPIDLEWISDYHEAIVGLVKAIPDSTLVLGWTQRIAIADNDEISAFEKFNEDRGAYVIDYTYSGIEPLTLGAYAMMAPDLFNAYGVMAEYVGGSEESFAYGALVKAAVTSEEVTGVEDGMIAQLELNGAIGGFEAYLGYITTDSDGGSGTITALGDNMSPFEDGNQVYAIDADTFYGSVAYTYDKLTVGALYGETEYAANGEETELDLTASYEIIDSLKAELLYAVVNNDVDGDYTKVLATLNYAF